MPAKKTTKKTAAKKAKADSSLTETKDLVTDPVKLSPFVKKQQQKLLELHADLMEALHGVQSEAIKAGSGDSDAGNGQHQGDAGSDSYDRDLALSMLEKEKDALHEIEMALDRIAQGTYGICEMSGEKIPKERLEVLPFARLTRDCQEKWEAEQRSRGVAPGEYGFGAFADSNRSVSLDSSDD
ncbi:TraR/DksA family transcriptional regulator [Roseibacillus ishigakijimensis]|uniref:TraR/DksA C4-type zinc finger protein n=1 Tax=Roseibacillus ishigakijimensis TaxID=454146 RepID=A0A934RTH4_9BACT|nr:TraR/DksA C4-type zinc finger protein [Roseibacillus ishigakijimensis]MBK1834216.1 TraR/DksA C4-type zinc finger protein [Roseibacillus ishigakijimensis]